MRSLRSLIAGSLLLLPLAPFLGSAARAQDKPAVRLELLDQTSFVRRKSPLRVEILATNSSKDEVSDLSATLGVYNPTGSRTEYQEALRENTSFPVFVSPFTVPGTLAPGESRTLVFERRLPELATRAESGLYPVEVHLESERDTIAILRTAITFVHERPLVPLNVAVTVVLDEEIVFRPDGVLLDDRLPKAIFPGGRVEAVVAALEAAPVQATLVLSPLMVEQIDQMSRGYRIAGTGTRIRTFSAESPSAQAALALLERLRALARDPRIEIVALPLASPSVPALVGAELLGDLASQLVRGRKLLTELLPGAGLTETLFFPPGGALTPRAIRALGRLRIETLLGDHATFEAPPVENLTPPPVALVAGGRSMRVVIPDPGVAGHLRGQPPPRLRVQQALGELSAIYFEQPGADRATALLFDAERPEDVAILGPFLSVLREASPEAAPKAGWIRPVKASRVASGLATDVPRRALRRVQPALLSPLFLNGLRQARRAIEELEAVTMEDPPLVERLKRLLFVAESRHFTAREHRGLALLRAIRAQVDREFAKVDLPSGTAVTLTARRGLIPITVGSRAGYPLRVRVRLVSPGLRFLEGAPRTLLLDRPRQAFTFPVLASTTGRFPVRILLETPRGAPIGESQIVVRSTAYNTKAFLVVAAAGIFLVALWIRRLLRARA